MKKVVNGLRTVFVYDAGGALAAEYSEAANTESGTQYLTADHLGSTRLVTDADGAPVHDTDYYPFGEEIGGGDWFNPKFTGKERDYESGLNLDYFGARYYGGAMGRFTGADPDNYDARLEEPRSWNMYAYTWNNPLKYRDDNGRAVNLALAAIGSGVGFGTGFAGSAVSQYIDTGNVDWGKAMAYGAGGAVSGATAGFTFGGSLVVQAVAGIGLAAAGNVTGGVTARALAGEDAVDTEALGSDLENGLVGGTVGAGVQFLGTVAKLPVKPKLPTPLANVKTSLKRMAKLRAWERQRDALSNRFSAVGATFGSMYTNVVRHVHSAWDNGQNRLAYLWFELASRQQQPKPKVKSKICYAGESGCPETQP